MESHVFQSDNKLLSVVVGCFCSIIPSQQKYTSSRCEGESVLVGPKNTFV